MKTTPEIRDILTQDKQLTNAVITSFQDNCRAIPERAHMHVCTTCSSLYIHSHFGGLGQLNHGQFKYQCPNVKCPNSNKLSNENRDAYNLLISDYDSRKPIFHNCYRKPDANWLDGDLVRHTIKFEDGGVFEKGLPGTKIIKNLTDPNGHPHPMGQKLRDIMETIMFYMISSYFPVFYRFGVGDNLKRNKQKSIGGFSINYKMDQRDHDRQNEYIRQNDVQYAIDYCYCGATKNLCNHTSSRLFKNTQTVVTAVDSYYYPGVEDFMKQMIALSNTTMFHNHWGF